MPSLKQTLFKVPDRELLAGMSAIAAAIKAPNVPIRIQFASDHNQTPSFVASNYLQEPLVAKLLEADGALVWRASMNLGDRSIRVDRGPTTDEAHISFPDGALDIQVQNVEFLAAIQTHLRTYGRTAATDEVLGGELAEFYRQREAGLIRLEELSQRIIEGSEQQRQRMEQRVEDLRAQLLAEHDRKLTALDEEYSGRAKRLIEAEAELAQRQAEVDDRSAKHARRQIRQDVKAIIAQRSASFTLSKDTNKKRAPIHALFVGLVGTSGALFVLSLLGYLPVAPSVPTWLAVLRLPLIAAALAASLVFYIRWSDLWFHQHADEEMRLKRLEIDIDRASWVVEMALEWKAEKGSELPAELVDRLSRNLFERDAPARAVHPTEELASALLGASAGLTLNIPGLGEAKLDRKGMKQFQKSLEDRDSV